MVDRRSGFEMAKGKPVKKERIPELKVVLDTNSIYTQREHFLLKPEVYELIQDNHKHSDITLTWYLPEVVRHERQYQMINNGIALLPSINKIEKILGHNLNLTEDTIRQRIPTLIDQQIQDSKIEILQIKTDMVDWNSLILNAAYRKPPFSAGEKEKGFRDALIAESFLQLVSISPSTTKICNIVLITEDGLLTEFIKTRTIGAKNIRVLSSIEELKGLINTLVSQVSEEFVESIKAKAKVYFFVPGDDNTLFYKEKIWVKINKQYRKQLSAIPLGATEREHLTTEIGSPQFVKKERTRVFWKNRITEVVKAYNKEDRRGEKSTYPQLIGDRNLDPSTFLFHLYDEPDERPIIGESSYLFEPLIPFPEKKISGEWESFVRNTLPALKSKTLLNSGKIIFEVIWSVVVTAQNNLIRPQIESIEYIETVWE